MAKKSYPVANQKERREYFYKWAKSLRISGSLVPILVPWLGFGMGITFFRESQNILVLWFFIISTGFSLVSGIWIFGIRMSETVRFYYNFVIIAGSSLLSTMYTMFLGLLVAFNPDINVVRFLWIQFILLLVFVLSCKLIQSSWKDNFSVNAQFLFKEKPYIRFFSVLAPKKDIVRSSANLVPTKRMTGPIFYCILFPTILSERSIQKYRNRYEYGTSPMRNWHTWLMLLVTPISLSVRGWIERQVPLLQGILLPSLCLIVIMIIIIGLCRHLVIYQGLKSIEKREGITFLPYFMKPQEEVDAEAKKTET